jgi:hypothetical protein
MKNSTATDFGKTNPKMFAIFQSLHVSDCETVWGPDADRHAKILTIIRLEGSKFDS